MWLKRQKPLGRVDTVGRVAGCEFDIEWSGSRVCDGNAPVVELILSEWKLWDDCRPELGNE